MESRKMVEMNLFEGRNRGADVENRLVDARREGECGTNREGSIDIHTPPRMK